MSNLVPRDVVDRPLKSHEALNAENQRLREALEPFVKETPHIYLDHYRDMLGSAVEKARAALAAPGAKEGKP